MTGRFLMFVVLCLALSSDYALAQVGIVRTIEGQVSVVSGKQECAPQYGLDLEEGNELRTNGKSWALLTMTDGTKITLRPETEVQILIYRYTESGETWQNRALLVLTRGALRVSTGRLVSGNNSGFAVRTPDASIEVRGTDHDITYIVSKPNTAGEAGPGTYSRSYAGEIVLKNEHGNVTLTAGQVAFAEPRVHAPPRMLNGYPRFYYAHDHVDRRVAAVAGRLDAVTLP